jgi:hypothetical protein
MPPVDILNGASQRDACPALTQQVRSETLANEPDADQLGERTASAPADADQQSTAFHAHEDGIVAAAPARSVRRATARRASIRRATARRRQNDPEASIIDFLARHPGSTAGDLAKRLNLDPESVSHRLTQLAKTDEITKASHGYTTKQPTRPQYQPPSAARAESRQDLSEGGAA